jgi:hypothetical protein
MEHQEWFAKGGWRGRMDYYQMADCTGEALMTEQVLGLPGAYRETHLDTGRLRAAFFSLKSDYAYTM